MSVKVEVITDAETTEPAATYEIADAKDSENQMSAKVLSAISAMAMGFIFGFLFEKSHCYEPTSIRGQFIFKKWIMIKMFMGAVTGACLMFTTMSVATPKLFEKVRDAFPPPQRGFVSGGILGGVLLGFGMVIAGACPGMVIPQVGTLLPNSHITMAGGIVGALTFGLVEPYVQPFLHKGIQCTQDKNAFLDVKLGKPFPLMCLALGAVCAAVCVLLEIVVPFGNETLTSPDGVGVFEQKAWAPSLCGLFLGCLQLPCGLCCQDSLGSSTAYQVVSAQWLHLMPQTVQSRYEYLNNFKSGIGVWWQVFYIGLAVLGSYASGALSDSIPTSAAGVSAPSAFIGGFLMLFGSRFGGGCTSGHGISGMPLLHSLSIVGVCAMFGSAIILGFIMDFTDTLEIKGLEGWS
eukprot:gnl/MRDRNA2_/MRDRNA2_73899_c0_seq2.p1 gnl/MRDRNA2_/MRDRNA2_73899_c0~~gnl/MRDRNA2_/MRDRNA2_73899_c0_seq2.p1  ORF type:complete len:405 (+),score=51.86 gnl/MRDRNA2_/MRDRNA2_73899_c0_seq2:80-1294(+)